MTVVASIDIGTNSTRLLIASKDGANLNPLRMEERITRLGEGLGQLGYLKPESLDRVTDALTEYMGYIKACGTERVFIVATSAAREASNKEMLQKRVKEATGHDCRIISGQEEAELTFLGVMSDICAISKALICDIGGGSTEFIFTENGILSKEISLPIGSRRLKERFLYRNPVCNEEMQAFTIHTEAILHQHLFSGNEVQCVMVGGTATTLAMIDCSLSAFDENTVHGYVLQHSAVINIVQKLASLSLEERKHLVGLHPKRADVIVAGAMITEIILRFFKLSSCQISIRDLLFGLLA
ncbi:MAG TPA: Ppx/GppA phosphatase family protein [Thermodesulfovibrionia bacterium]|nr:Ppx/GppA phosphatase family protein [Thermodesulfovibrionia bacterium]